MSGSNHHHDDDDTGDNGRSKEEDIDGSAASYSYSSSSSSSSSSSLHSVHALQLDTGSPSSSSSSSNNHHNQQQQGRYTTRRSSYGDATTRVIATTTTKMNTTFRESVQREWIRAVLGTPPTEESSSTRKGQGLAKLGEYTCYTVTIPLKNNYNNTHSPEKASTTTGETMQTKEHHHDDVEPSSSSSLGLSLARLTVGLYVYHVQVGSEAWCAGILPESILLSINGMALLAEPSQKALERIWQYEGYSSATTPTATSSSSTTTTNDLTNKDATTNDDTTVTAASDTASASTKQKMRKIQEPFHMTLLHSGQVYSVVLLSNPPYGIDWAPCANLCLVKKAHGKAQDAGIVAGSIITRIGSTHPPNNEDATSSSSRKISVDLMRDDTLDHTLAAQTLRTIRTSSSSSVQQDGGIQLSLCILPRQARSGFYENEDASTAGAAGSRHRRRTTGTTTTATTKTPAVHMVAKPQPKPHRRPRKMAAYSLEGIQVRIHPLFQSAASAATATTTASPTRPLVPPSSSSSSTAIKSLSQLAFQVAAGEVFSFSSSASPTTTTSHRLAPQGRTGGGTTFSYYSQRQFRPCPPLDQPLSDLLSMDQALTYLLQYQEACYDETKLASHQLGRWMIPTTSTSTPPCVLRFLQNCGSGSSSVDACLDALDTFLLPLLALIKVQGWEDSKLSQTVVELVLGERRTNSGVDIPLVHRMEYMTYAMGLHNIHKQMVDSRGKRMLHPPPPPQKRRAPRQIPIRIEQRAPESPMASVVTGTTVPSTLILSDVSRADEDDLTPTAATSTNTSSRKGIFGLFRKKKKKSKAGLEEGLGAKGTSSTVSKAKKTLQVKKTGISSRRSIRSPLSAKAFASTNSAPTANKDVIFANTLSLLEELEATCLDVEKSLLRSFSQKVAAWALQPWSANRETELAQVTQIMRERLRKFSALPLLNPIDSSSTLVSVDTQESYILPSAHFPLLLTFDCDDASTISDELRSPFGGDETIYRTKVELLDLVGKDISPEETVDRIFIVHGSVGGAVMKSGPSIPTNRKGDQHAWDDNNVLSFESRSSWGPPVSLSLGLSQSADKIIGSDENGKLKYDRDMGECFVDFSSLWREISDGDAPPDAMKVSKTFQLKLRAQLSLDDFDQHGDLTTKELDQVPQDIEIRIKVSLQKIPLSGQGGLFSKKRSLLYKHDDDLRQELFAIEFVKSCDTILRSCGLDLEILTFQCIPVGQQRGFIEWIHGSVPVSEICQPFAGSILCGKIMDPPRSVSGVGLGAHNSNSEEALSSVAKAGLTKYEALHRFKNGKESKTVNPIQDFLRAFQYSPDDPYMIRKSVMQTYIKSCAGYCAITYILGVGDRHLDNLLIHPTGHFFHCDYSFILGHDPKKYLPLRITGDMVNGMGGRDSDNYALFLSLTCAAFLTLRRPENVRHLLSFVRMMEGSCTFASSSDSMQPLETALMGIRERLRLDLTDDEAISFMERLVEESCTSKMWIAVDAIHSLGKRF